jgi:RHS repeat-associated protein
VVQTPGGLTETILATRTAALANPNDPLSATALADTVVVNGKVSTRAYDAATRTVTSISPSGRVSTATLDALGRFSEIANPGIVPVRFGYDAQGRSSAMTQGARSWSFTYDPNWALASMTDPLGRRTEIVHDAAGRPTRQMLPAGRATDTTYDSIGNPTAVSPPASQAHGFSYGASDLLSSYQAPPVGGAASTTHLVRDLDHDLAEIVRPDGRRLSFVRDAAGRLASSTTDLGTTLTTYDTPGRLLTVGGPGASLGYSWDGFLATGEALSGATTGTVTWTHDADLRVASVAVNGGAPAAFQYDDDGLITGAGSLAISRDGASGRITGTTLGVVATSWTYDGYGQVASMSAAIAGAPVFSWTVSRDATGRITGKTETVQGATVSHGYDHDPAGFLSAVSRNGALVSQWTYDPNGNRGSAVDASAIAVATFDAQDRILTQGAANYVHGLAGERERSTSGAKTTSYSYDARGIQIGATLPDGRVVSYVVDPRGRRVGKSVNGSMVEGFLYDGHLRPVAWLDGTGAVKATFVHATWSNVPEYMVTDLGTYRFLSDQLGSPRLLVDDRTGAVAQAIEYDAWGRVTADTNPGFQPFGFAGGLLDRDTGLVHLGAREYDPGTGRWMSRDPLLFGGGQSNLYAYVDNDPVNRIDPSGLGDKCPGEKTSKKPRVIVVGGSGGLANMAFSALFQALPGANLVDRSDKMVKFTKAEIEVVESGYIDRSTGINPDVVRRNLANSGDLRIEIQGDGTIGDHQVTIRKGDKVVNAWTAHIGPANTMADIDAALQSIVDAAR